MSCTLKRGAKALDVCQLQDSVVYRYGPRSGTPELELSDQIRDLDYRPWNGVGRSIYEEVSFHNGQYRYTVYSAYDKILESNYPLSGGIVVSKSGETIAQLECDPGSVNSAIDALMDEKESAGLCWHYDSVSWTPCSN